MLLHQVEKKNNSNKLYARRNGIEEMGIEEMGKKINDSLGGNSPSGRIFLDHFFMWDTQEFQQHVFV